MDSSFLTNAKSSAVTALIGAVGIGIQHTDINELSKVVLGIALAATMVFRAVIAFVEMIRKFKQKETPNE